MSIKILLIDDDKMQRKMIRGLLENKLGYQIVEADGGKTGLDIVKQDQNKEIRLVILDIYMPDMDGMEVLGIMSQQYPDLPVIMLTGSSDINVVVQAMQLGASDFLNKPPEPGRLQVSIKNALKISVLEKEVNRLKKQEDGVYSFKQMIGHEGGLSKVIGVGRKAASADIPVLLTGETGVGKEVFAKSIHGESNRIGKPFIAVNCGAIPENLVESILFGHEKGSFTGAIAKSIGKFREAEGGTIFLDEVGELPLDTQVKLLRVLQQKEITSVGGQSSIPVNIRIISATNKNLDTEVMEGRFRDDLYFRLNVLPINIPPIRDRRQDIAELIYHFIERFTVIEGQELKDISDEAINMLKTWEWGGNVREIENTIHRAIVLSDNDILDIQDFYELPNVNISNIDVEKNKNYISILNENGYQKTLEQIEEEVIKLSLLNHNNNITQTALSLGMAKSTFYRKTKKEI